MGFLCLFVFAVQQRDDELPVFEGKIYKWLAYDVFDILYKRK
jgi:hypothetical protein